MVAISYRSIICNTKLTDFEDTKIMVLYNAIKNVPSIENRQTKTISGFLPSNPAGRATKSTRSTFRQGNRGDNPFISTEKKLHEFF